MTEEEKLLETIKEQVKDLIAESDKESVKKGELDKAVADLNANIAKLSNEEMKTLKESVDKLVTGLEDTNKSLVESNTALKTQGEALKGLVEKGNPSKDAPKSFYQALKESVLEKGDLVLTEKNDDEGKRKSLKDWFTEKGNQQTPTFTVKVAVDMLESNIVQSNVNLVRLTDLDPNLVGIPLTVYPHVIDWIPSKTITKKNMSVMVAYTYVDGAGTKTEGAASGQSSFLFKTKEFASVYVATYFTLSDETLDDLDEAMQEIAIVAPSKILDKIDGYVLGTTGDDLTTIGGLFIAAKHTDFATATYTNTVVGANVIDLVAKAKLQCETAKYRPNVAVMNPTDVDNMAALRDANDNSILDRRVRWDALGNPAFVMGMRIMTSPDITANTLAVLDLNQLILGKRKEMTMDIGYNGTDLTEGQKTVVIKTRLAFAVRDSAAVIYSDDIATDVAAIDNPGA